MSPASYRAAPPRAVVIATLRHPGRCSDHSPPPLPRPRTAAQPLGTGLNGQHGVCAAQLTGTAAPSPLRVSLVSGVLGVAFGSVISAAVNYLDHRCARKCLRQRAQPRDIGSDQRIRRGIHRAHGASAQGRGSAPSRAAAGGPGRHPGRDEPRRAPHGTCPPHRTGPAPQAPAPAGPNLPLPDRTCPPCRTGRRTGPDATGARRPAIAGLPERRDAGGASLSVFGPVCAASPGVGAGPAASPDPMVPGEAGRTRARRRPWTARCSTR